MAELTPLYMDISNVYSGDELGLPYRDIMGEGIVGAGDLAVTQHAGGANLSVDVAAGAAWILGDTDTNAQPCYRVRNDAVVNRGITPDPSNPRIVLIVGQITDQTFAGTSRQWAITAIHGTPAASPVAPALPASALLLATVTVPAAATSIVTANIADSRVRAVVGAGQAQGGGGLVKLWDSVEAGVTLPAASITTPTLPQTYKHLVIEISGRSDAAVLGALTQFRVNGDVSASWDWQHMSVQASAAPTASEGLTATAALVGALPGASAATNRAGLITVRLLNYAAAIRHSYLSQSVAAEGNSTNASGVTLLRFCGGTTDNANAVTTLTFLPGSGNFAAGTRITIYGEA